MPTFTKSQLRTIVWLTQNEYNKQIKTDYKNGLKSGESELAKRLLEINNIAYHELTHWDDKEN